MRKLYALILVLFIGVVSEAQPTHYNHAATTGGTTNSFPFNINSAIGKRVQWIITNGGFGLPSPALPGNNITTVWFWANNAGTATYTNLTVRMATVPTSTFFTTGAFYTGPMTTVRSQNTAVTPSGANTWVGIPLTTPYLYDPAMSLIIEVSHCGYTGGGFSLRQLSFGAAPNFRRQYSDAASPCGSVALPTGGDLNVAGIGISVTPATQPCAENFDGAPGPALPAGWSASTPTTCAGSTPWVKTSTVSSSAPNSAFSNDPACISDELLDSRVFPIVSPTAQLSFRNSYDLETGFDGMVLEVSIGGGPFTDIITAGGSFVTGGYNGTISVNFASPILGRSAWTGNSGGFITTTVNLPAVANGQNVVFRWRRATDSSVGGAGAWIDNITITGSDCTSGGGCLITCPPNMIVSNNANQCGAVVNYPAPTSNGACGPITASPASGSFFPVGLTTVTVSTFSGPSCTFTIRVNDTQPPTITCPANITTGNTTGQCGAVVNFSPVASDNCPGVVVTSSPASGSTFPIGTTTVSSTATDASGNTATCSFTVTVTDTENPTFSSPGLIPERLYYRFDGTGTSVPNLATAPPVGTATATLTGVTQGLTGKCGGALVGTGTANQSMNTNWATNMTGPWTISFWLGPNQLDANPSYLFGDVNAGSFRCFYGGAALPNNILLRGGSGDVLITGVNPTATLITIVYNGVNTVVYKNGASPQTYAVTFSNVGPGPFRVGGYSTLASINGRLDEFSMYSRALTAAEALSLFNTCPVAINNCPSAITVSNTPGVCGAVVNYTTPVGVDNCPGVTTTQISGLPSGSTFPIGTTTNLFRATDGAGNIANCSFTVTVNDTQAPAISCPPNITIPTPVGFCTVAVPFTVTATDNCPGTTIVSSPASGSVFSLGTTTVTSTATDASGNTATCTFTVTVIDGQLPLITAPPVNRTVCAGSNAVFSVTAINVVTYQWQQWNGSAWVNLAGTNSNTYTVSNTTVSMNTNTFRVVMTGLCTTINSNAVTLFVNPLPSVTVSANPPGPILPGQTTTLTAFPTIPGGTFAWFFNGTPIPGANAASLGPLSISQLGTYRVVYTAPTGCTATSADFEVGGAASEGIWVYPNPNRGQFQVRFFNQLNEKATVNVFDAKGRKVHQEAVVTGGTTYSQIDIDLGPTANGIYIVEVVNGSGKRIATKRINVQSF